MSAIPLKGDYAVVADVLRRRASVLGNKGFDFVDTALQKSAVMEHAMFRFLNKRTGMEIRVSFAPASAGLNGGFGVLITKPVDLRLNVEDYLKKHNKPELTKHFTYRDPATDIRDFAESFLDLLEKLFNTDLKPIVDGTLFEETPIDWGDYK